MSDEQPDRSWTIGDVSKLIGGWGNLGTWIASVEARLVELSQLRADLTTAKAERDQAREGWKTTSALAVETQNDLEATRAELAKAEALVNKLLRIMIHNGLTYTINETC